MMSSGLPSYTVPPSTAKSPAGHPFGANSPSGGNPSATQPFASPADATQPHRAEARQAADATQPHRGEAADASLPHRAGARPSADATQPFSAASQPPLAPPFSFGSPEPATQPYGTASQAPATQPFRAASHEPATQAYGAGSQGGSAEEAPHPYRDSTGHPYGVGGVAADRDPFGGFSAPSAQRTASPDTYGSSVPQQRDDGRGLGSDGYPSPDATMPVPTGFPSADATMPVYNYGSIDSTMPVSTNPVENSGSLTGHILAQGWHDEATDRRRSNVKVAVAMLVVLGLLVTVSLVFLFTAGDAFTNMVKGVFK
jgi:hypothetical protein